MSKSFQLFSLFIFSVSIAFSQPKIEISNNAQKDWGKVQQKDGPLTTQFKIYNKGNQLLKIYAVKPGCGCTTAPLDKTDIKPGEFATMNVVLQINKDEGKITKFITVTCNDPLFDKKDIELKARIIVPFSFFPAKNMMFGNISTKKENIGKIVLTNNLEMEVRILSVATFPNYVKVNLKAGDKLKPGQDFPLTCSFKNSKLEGKFEGKLTLHTSHPDMPIIDIPLLGMVDPGK